MHSRDRLLREIVQHTEAAAKLVYETPPVADNAQQYPQWAEMMRDATVAACVEAITSAILARPWCVRPAAQTPAALAVAQFIEENLREIDLEAALETALEALWRGFSAHEITWKYEVFRCSGVQVSGNGPERLNARTPEHRSQFFRLAGLADIHPDQIAFELDDQMRITAILSQPPPGLPLRKGEGNGAPEHLNTRAPERLPLEKVWLHRRKPSRQHPAGRSLLEPAYRAWRAKDSLLKFWGLALQRFGMPYVIAQIPESSSDGFAESVMNAFYQLRLDGVALLPESVAYQVHNPSSTTVLTFTEAIHYHDAQIRTAILLQFTEGSVMSREYITGEGLRQLARTTAYALQRAARSLCASFTQQVIAPLVAVNFGPAPEIVPRLTFPRPGETNLPEMASAWRLLVEAGIATPEMAREDMGLE